MKSRDFDAWIKELPHAHPAYPEAFADKVKYFFWRIITPFHPHVRDLLSYMQLLRNNGRQNYLLGRLAPGETAESFVSYLLEQGFGNHFIAFRDEGQVVSLRFAPDFKYQYHIRLFEDGEVRGHYEYTPEYRPILHMREEGMEARIEDFLTFLGNKIVPSPLTSGETSFDWSFAGVARRRN